MRSRAEIKWAAFDSLFHSKEAIQELEKKKNSCKKPTLSSDELDLLNTNLLEAYHTKALIKINYYYQGYKKEKIGIVSEINTTKKKIYFEDHSFLYFDQILFIDFI